MKLERIEVALPMSIVCKLSGCKKDLADETSFVLSRGLINLGIEMPSGANGGGVVVFCGEGLINPKKTKNSKITGTAIRTGVTSRTGRTGKTGNVAGGQATTKRIKGAV